MTNIKDLGFKVGFSLQVQILEVEREIKMRREVYPRLVHKGELKQSHADYQIACMEAVLKTLRDLKTAQDLKA